AGSATAVHTVEGWWVRFIVTFSRGLAAAEEQECRAGDDGQSDGGRFWDANCQTVPVGVASRRNRAAERNGWICRITKSRSAMVEYSTYAYARFGIAIEDSQQCGFVSVIDARKNSPAAHLQCSDPAVLRKRSERAVPRENEAGGCSCEERCGVTCLD